MVVAVSVSLSFVAHSARTYNKTVNLIAGKADTVELKGSVADILVADPSIADVGTLRSDRLYVVGKAVGDTNILAYDDAGNQLANIDVHVRVDDKNIQATLRDFFPDEKIRARTVKDNIVLTGTVSSPSVSNQIRDLAARFITTANQTLVDLMTVKGEQQVMLKVKVVEAKRSVLRDLGMELDYRDAATRGLTMNASDIGRTALTPFGAGSLLVGDKTRWGPLSTTLRALETNGMINTLAEPNLTAISGETAGFLAGGEYPVPTGRDTDGNVVIEFKQFGVSLNFTPTVMGKDRIGLHLSTEVSEKDSSNGVTLVNVQIDGLRVRRAETTVELSSGSTIMIAGLIKSDTLENLNGLPGAQDVPVLGELFKSKSFKRDESELLIMVTPYLVNSFAESNAVAEVSDPGALQKVIDKFKAKTRSPESTLAKKEAQKPLEKVKAKYSYKDSSSDERTGFTKKTADKVVKVEEAPVSKVTKIEKVAKIEVVPKPVEKIAFKEKLAVEPVMKASLEAPVIQEKKAVVAMVTKPQKTSNLLSERLISGLRKTYGKHMPENISNDDGIGYIVD